MIYYSSFLIFDSNWFRISQELTSPSRSFFLSTSVSSKSQVNLAFSVSLSQIYYFSQITSCRVSSRMSLISDVVVDVV